MVTSGLKADDLSDLIYNSVTTLLVGEKIMVEAPTYLFPSGAGVSGVSLPVTSTVANHGEPDPMATFRFAEPVTIDPQQNFRIEMLFPQGVPGDAAPPTRLAGAGSLSVLDDSRRLPGHVTCSDEFSTAVLTHKQRRTTMRYLGEDELTQVMGIGRYGEVREGPDGRLYQWVQGVDGLGNPIGLWRGLRRRLRSVVRRALPAVQIRWHRSSPASDRLRPSR